MTEEINNGKNEQRQEQNKQRQKQKQIPFGDDNQEKHRQERGATKPAKLSSACG
jgi:hypothetical protein